MPGGKRLPSGIVYVPLGSGWMRRILPRRSFVFADDFWALAEATDLYVIVANWPTKRREHWQTLLRARAIENQAWVIGLNRVGEGGGIDYSGDSMIIDPWGEVVCSASRDETMLLANVAVERVREARTKFPVLQDRRLR